MKPILFNTEMVKAILEGRKTVTRRVLVEKEILDKHWALDREPYKYKGEWVYDKQTEVDGSRTYTLKPKYQVGDILYVRETWLKADDGIHYRADETPASRRLRIEYGYKWKPSIHMPKSAARIFLKVTDVRVERLQDITSEQAKSEGVDLNSGTPFPKATARDCHGAKNGLSMYQSKFVILWDSTIKKQDLDKYSWKANPYVWVIEFERVKGGIASESM